MTVRRPCASCPSNETETTEEVADRDGGQERASVRRHRKRGRHREVRGDGAGDSGGQVEEVGSLGRVVSFSPERRPQKIAFEPSGVDRMERPIDSATMGGPRGETSHGFGEEPVDPKGALGRGPHDEKAAVGKDLGALRVLEEDETLLTADGGDAEETPCGTSVTRSKKIRVPSFDQATR